MRIAHKSYTQHSEHWTVYTCILLLLLQYMYYIALKHKTYVCFIIFSMLPRSILSLIKISFMAKNCDWAWARNNRREEENTKRACICARAKSEENGNWYEMKGNFKRWKSNNNKQREKLQAMKMKNLNEKFQTPKRENSLYSSFSIIYELGKLSLQCRALVGSS